jgi:hypothetical protein
MDLSNSSPAHVLIPLLRFAPPWVVLATLCGLTSAAAFFVVAGRGFRSLPTYLLLGILVAPLCQALAEDLPAFPPPLSIGEVNLVFVGLGTWGCLTIARLLRL